MTENTSNQSLDEALAAHREAVRLELEAFEARIDEEVEKMRAGYGPGAEFVGREYTRFIGRMDIHIRDFHESMRITGEALETLKNKWKNREKKQAAGDGDEGR